MGYYLLDNRNPNGAHYYSTRRRPLLAIVVHITAGLQDLVGADRSAEQTARYAATTDRKVSWHSGSDADSWLRLLPPGYTAWHAADYNGSTYGHEISKRDVSWSDEPAGWVDRTLDVAAAALAPVARAHKIPIRRATRAELDRAIAAGGPPVGFIAHSVLDPRRRRDPGADFPWAGFLERMKPAPKPVPEPKPAPKPQVSLSRVVRAFRRREDDVGNDAEQVQRALNARRPGLGLRVDGIVDAATVWAYRAHQEKLYGRGDPDADGIPGRDSLEKLGFRVTA